MKNKFWLWYLLFGRLVPCYIHFWVGNRVDPHLHSYWFYPFGTQDGFQKVLNLTTWIRIRTRSNPDLFLAPYLQTWRANESFLAVIIFPYILLLILMPESPRWLIHIGQIAIISGLTPRRCPVHILLPVGSDGRYLTICIFLWNEASWIKDSCLQKV